jgi:WD40 repeat protein
MARIVNSVRFNQDDTCFVCGINDGFAIFNVDPLKEILRVDLGCSIRIVEPLYRCSILALVGEEKGSAFDPNKGKPFYSTLKVFLVILFDCFVRKAVVELDVKVPVKNVLLRKNRISVVVESCILIYSLTDIPEHLFTIETSQNSAGICAISDSESNPLVIFPSKSSGHIGILLSNQRRLRVFKAHNHPIQCIALNLNGNLIASASSKGTLVRVFNAESTHLLYEFRRGSNNAIISW